MARKRTKGPLLVGRRWHVKCAWYESVRLLRERFRSIVKAEYFESDRSSGNWGGYIIQEIGGAFYYGILFSQERAGDGVTVITHSEHVAVARTAEDAERAVQQYLVYKLW